MVVLQIQITHGDNCNHFGRGEEGKALLAQTLKCYGMYDRMTVVLGEIDVAL